MTYFTCHQNQFKKGHLLQIGTSRPPELATITAEEYCHRHELTETINYKPDKKMSCTLVAASMSQMFLKKTKQNKGGECCPARSRAKRQVALIHMSFHVAF